MFDFTPVGLGARGRGRALPGVRLPAAADGSRGRRQPRRGARHQDYVTEARVPADSRDRRQDGLATCAGMADGDVEVVGDHPRRDPPLRPLAGCARAARTTSCCWRASRRSSSIVARGGSQAQRRARTPARPSKTDEIGVIEAVVGPNSPLIGRSAERLAPATSAIRSISSRSAAAASASPNGCATSRLQPATSSCCRATCRDCRTRLTDLGCLPLAQRDDPSRQRAAQPDLPIAGARHCHGAGGASTCCRSPSRFSAPACFSFCSDL